MRCAARASWPALTATSAMYPTPMSPGMDASDTMPVQVMVPQLRARCYSRRQDNFASTSRAPATVTARSIRKRSLTTTHFENTFTMSTNGSCVATLARRTSTMLPASRITLLPRRTSYKLPRTTHVGVRTYSAETWDVLRAIDASSGSKIFCSTVRP